jgi:hypothetical protein
MTGGMNLLSAVFCSDSVNLTKESEETTGAIKQKNGQSNLSEEK